MKEGWKDPEHLNGRVWSRKRAGSKRRHSCLGCWWEDGDRRKGCWEEMWLKEEIWDFHLVMTLGEVYRRGYGVEDRAQGWITRLWREYDKDVRTAWQTEYRKTVRSQSRYRQGQRGWSRNEQKTSRQNSGGRRCIRGEARDTGHEVRLGQWRGLQQQSGCPFWKPAPWIIKMEYLVRRELSDHRAQTLHFKIEDM